MCTQNRALSGVSPAGNPAFTDSFAESADRNMNIPTAEPQNAFQKSCNEFITFFNRRRASAIRALPTSQADREHHARYPMRSKCFRPGTRMYDVLSRVDTGYTSPDKRRAVDNCRLACLIYLNIVVSEYGDFSADTESFLQTIVRFVEDDDLDCALSAEHLLWSLIRGVEPQEARERPWKVSRMIGVMKTVSQEMWWEVEEALRLFLITPDDGSDLMQRISVWDFEKFRLSSKAFAELEFAPLSTISMPSCTKTPYKIFANDFDFLPETPDTQRFPRSEAATDGGVQTASQVSSRGRPAH